MKYLAAQIFTKIPLLNIPFTEIRCWRTTSINKLCVMLIHQNSNIE